MKRIKLLASLLVAAVSMLMTSCDMDELLYSNMLEKTKWMTEQTGVFTGSDGNIYPGVKAIVFHFKTATKGELTVTITTNLETTSETVPFEYKYTDSMISGTITVKKGEYSGKYDVAYNLCDENLILYNSTAGVSMVLSKVTD